MIDGLSFYFREATACICACDDIFKGGEKMDARQFIGGGATLSAKIVKDEMLEGKPLTIVEVRERIFGDNPETQKKKLVLSFDETDYELALNATNTRILADAFGYETDEWLDKQIALNIVKTRFQGQLVDAIQIKAEKSA